MKIVSIIFLILAFCGNQYTQNSTNENSILNLNPAPLSEVKIAKKITVRLKQGDFIHPKISPDGRRLAFSRVVVQKETELCEIAVYNFQTKHTSVLLTPTASKKYATYSAFVTELEWLDDNRLRAEISDGDVDLTILTFNANTRRIVKTEYGGASEDPIADLIPAKFRLALSSLTSLFPQISKEAIETGLQNNPILLGEKGIVMQYRHFGFDSNIRRFDFDAKTEKILLRLPEEKKGEPITAFLGGTIWKDAILFGVYTQGTVYLVEQRGDESKLLYQQMIDEDAITPSLEIKVRNSEKLFLLLKSKSEKSGKTSVLFVHDGKKIFRVADVPNLEDADLNLKTNKIVFSFWTDKKRQLTVSELSK